MAKRKGTPTPKGPKSLISSTKLKPKSKKKGK